MPDSIETDDPGPQEAHVHGYKPIGDVGPQRQRDPNGLITITGWFKDSESRFRDGEQMREWEARNTGKFEREAGEIYRVLSNNLPGGTLHQLLIKFLQGQVNLYVVQDIPDTTIKDIAELARAFVWEPEQWEAFVDSKDSNSVAWPPEWLLLCQAVEKRYGPPPTED